MSLPARCTTILAGRRSIGGSLARSFRIPTTQRLLPKVAACHGGARVRRRITGTFGCGSWKTRPWLTPVSEVPRQRPKRELLSGDRVDVVYFADEQVLAIEVKSRDSNRADLLRGIYQCIKYGAVLRAQEDGAREVRTLLVTETALPDDLARVANRLDVRHRCIALASK